MNIFPTAVGVVEKSVIIMLTSLCNFLVISQPLDPAILYHRQNPMKRIEVLLAGMLFAILIFPSYWSPWQQISILTQPPLRQQTNVLTQNLVRHPSLFIHLIVLLRYLSNSRDDLRLQQSPIHTMPVL